ncbi:MAG: hypothetical protein DRO65_01695, partial [Candidatus Altiarchaeales archaeon]
MEKHEIERCINHLFETNDIRRILWQMDNLVPGLRYGIKQGDDAIIVDDIIINIEGPYPLKIGRKTGLIHTCSDVVVMGGKPLFALNAMQVSSLDEAKEAIEDIKKQSSGLNVPIIGGNTQLESDLKPCVSFAVVGKLVAKPIPDSGCEVGDKILMLGDVVEGEIGERIRRAKVKFETYLEILDSKIKINASKDCSRGGWFGNLLEMLVKSKKGIKLSSIPYPNIGRYLGNYLISTNEKYVDKILEIASKHRCPVLEIGEIIEKPEITLGKRIIIEEKKLREIIRKFP